MSRRYIVLLYPEPEEGGYSVSVPSLPGCVTQGETVEEAIANAQEAAEGWLLAERDRDGYLPGPDDRVIAASIEVAIEITDPVPTPA